MIAGEQFCDGVTPSVEYVDSTFVIDGRTLHSEDLSSLFLEEEMGKRDVVLFPIAQTETLQEAKFSVWRFLEYRQEAAQSILKLIKRYLEHGEFDALLVAHDAFREVGGMTLSLRARAILQHVMLKDKSRTDCAGRHFREFRLEKDVRSAAAVVFRPYYEGKLKGLGLLVSLTGTVHHAKWDAKIELPITKCGRFVNPPESRMYSALRRAVPLEQAKNIRRFCRTCWPR